MLSYPTTGKLKFGPASTLIARLLTVLLRAFVGSKITLAPKSPEGLLQITGHLAHSIQCLVARFSTNALDHGRHAGWSHASAKQLMLSTSDRVFDRLTTRLRSATSELLLSNTGKIAIRRELVSVRSAFWPTRYEICAVVSTQHESSKLSRACDRRRNSIWWSRVFQSN